MRPVLAAGVLVLALSACSSEIPLLNPDLPPAKILAFPGQAGITDAHYTATYSQPDGTVSNVMSGTVVLKPVRALSQFVTGGKGVPAANSEYREVNGVAYNEALPGWRHRRWFAGPAPPSGNGGFGTLNPVYFDAWPGLGTMRVEGQEGSAIDRAWRLVGPAAQMGPQATIRVWIRQRDGYPLKFELNFVKGRNTVLFDRINSGARVATPAARDLLPPPASLPDAGSYSWSGGSVRALTVDYAYRGGLMDAPSAGSHLVAVETYLDTPNQAVIGDVSKWELLAVDGTAYRALSGGIGPYFGKGTGGDQLAFFIVADSARGPFSLHVVLTAFPGKGTVEPQPVVAVDTVIRLS